MKNKFVWVVGLLFVLLACACDGVDEVALAEAQASQARAEADKLAAEYEGQSILEMARALSHISVADSEALRDLATEQMRTRESWETYVQALGLLGVFAVLYLLAMNSDFIRTLLLLRWGPHDRS